jgi:hypothetical protein
MVALDADAKDRDLIELHPVAVEWRDLERHGLIVARLTQLSKR